LHVSEVDDRLAVNWVYSASLFERRTIERLAESFATLLAAIADAPGTPVQSLPLLPVSDRRCLPEWSAPRFEARPRLCAHELFEAQVRDAPDALAAVFDGESISYAELNAQ